MERIRFVSYLFSTLILFGLFVVLFLRPPVDTNTTVETPNDTNVTEQNNNLSPNYNNLTEEQVTIADVAIGNLLNSGKGYSPSDISVEVFSEEEFSDSSLGCPKPNEAYATVITPGYKVLLSAGGSVFDYRISEDTSTVVLCEQ